MALLRWRKSRGRRERAACPRTRQAGSQSWVIIAQITGLSRGRPKKWARASEDSRNGKRRAASQDLRFQRPKPGGTRLPYWGETDCAFSRSTKPDVLRRSSWSAFAEGSVLRYLSRTSVAFGVRFSGACITEGRSKDIRTISKMR